MKKIILYTLLFSVLSAKAQNDTTSSLKVNLEGFLDVYYAYDFDDASKQDRQSYIFNHNRNNTFSFNLALLKLTAETDNFRSNITFQLGDYVHYNLAHEPNALKNVFEAYGGVKIAKKVWVDVGVFSSNLGFESAISTENISLTRSLVAESSPYYLAGAKVIYEPNDKWKFTGLLTNGWQIIADNNQGKAIGTQIEHNLTENILLNYSTFIGDEIGNGTLRIFNDFYTKIKVSEKINFIGCVDYGMEGINTWLGTAFLVQYNYSEKISFGLRGESFNDPNYIAYIGEPTVGGSFNIDIKPNKFATWRTEIRTFNFYNNNTSNTFAISSLAFKF